LTQQNAGLGLRRSVPDAPSFRLRTAAAELAGVPTHALSESLVTEYAVGAGIGWHRDSPQFGIIAGISLGGGCRMRFQRGEGEQRQTWMIELPPRSLYVMSGIAREEWQHSIPPVKEPRWSITFRTLKDVERLKSPARGSTLL